MTTDRPPMPRLTEFGPEHSIELTSFDRTVFAGFHEVDEDFYYRLFEDGARIVGHQDEQGAIVSVGALYLQPLSDRAAPTLEQRLPEWAGFLDGAAVDPRYRTSVRPDLDLHGELLEWRIHTARDLGKTVALSVVRSDNVPSDRNLRRKHFHALVDAPGYYGPRPQDDRIAGAILLDLVNTLSWQRPPSPTPISEIEHALADQQATIALLSPRRIDTDYPPHYRQAVSRLLQNGYISGYAGPTPDIVPFTHLKTSNTLPLDIKSRLLRIRSVMHELCRQ